MTNNAYGMKIFLYTRIFANALGAMESWHVRGGRRI